MCSTAHPPANPCTTDIISCPQPNLIQARSRSMRWNQVLLTRPCTNYDSRRGRVDNPSLFPPVQLPESTDKSWGRLVLDFFGGGGIFILLFLASLAIRAGRWTGISSTGNCSGQCCLCGARHESRITNQEFTNQESGIHESRAAGWIGLDWISARGCWSREVTDRCALQRKREDRRGDLQRS